MTISSTTRVAGPFIGAGSTATFPFTFKVFAETDLQVVERNLTTGVDTLLALTTDYTVALNDNQDSSPGGSITLVAGNLASGLTLTLTTGIPQLQGLDLTNGGAFYPDVINAALDLLTILVQQLVAQGSRSLQVPVSDTGVNMELPAASARASKILMFDASGNLSLVPLAPGAAVPGAQNASGAVDGTNTVFTFSASDEAAPMPMVFAGGVLQTLGTDYSAPVSLGGGSWKITFTVAPSQGPITIALFA